MQCINPIISVSSSKFQPVQSAVMLDNNHREYYRDGVAYGESDVYQFPCRKCYFCLLARAREWTVRCVLEARCHTHNCILTLTYKDSPRSVKLRDMQLFFKRLRKVISPVKIRYFYGAEYGKQYMRPHYHCIIFGYAPQDLTVYTVKNGRTYYTSDLINKVWAKGYVTIDINPKESGIAYSCGYVMTKCLQKFPQDLTKPFQRMSNRPAIGYQYYSENAEKIYDIGIYVNGKKVSIPDYFDTKYKDTVSPAEWNEILQMRMENIDNHAKEGHIFSQREGTYRIKELLYKTIDKRKGL